MEKISNTVIKWADFPETVDSVKGRKTGEVFEVSFPSNYAVNVKYVTDIKRLVKICLITGVVLFTFDLNVLAATGIDEQMTKLYYDKFIGIAKIIIAGKGGFDTLSKLMKEDFDGAKRSAFQYLIAFGVIMGLPKALNFIETLFIG